MNRRDVLTVGAGLALSTTLAGCFSVEQNESESASDDTEPTTTDDDSELDLREANVVSVAVDDSDGASTFTVGLYHDDAGEEGYADWWQVETIDGTQLGRRDLTHPHDQQPFERPGTIEIPDDVTCVVVRGHDQTHGYGGQAMLVGIPDGETATARQGSDRQAFDESDCP